MSGLSISSRRVRPVTEIFTQGTEKAVEALVMAVKLARLF